MKDFINGLKTYIIGSKFCVSEPQDVLQALREALAGKKDKQNTKRDVDLNSKNKESKSEDEDDSHQKVKSKNVS